MKKPTRTPLTAGQLADAQRLSEIYKSRVRQSKDLTDTAPLTQTEVGERCGWNSPQSTVSQYMNGKVALNLDALVKLAKALDFEPDEVSPTLAAGIRFSLAEAPIEGVDKPLSVVPGDQVATNWDDFAFVDQYAVSASAGSGYDNSHVVLRNTLAFKREWLRYKGVNPKHLQVIYADGDSMHPTINHRDVLLVDGSHVEPVDDQIFVIEVQDRGTIVKRLVRNGSDGWIVRSDNPDKDAYEDEVLPDGEIYEHRILGRVIWRGGDL